MQSLKASLQSHPLLADVPFSTNDTIIALTWLLQSDARGHSRPGQGPKDSIRCDFLPAKVSFKPFSLAAVHAIM